MLSSVVNALRTFIFSLICDEMTEQHMSGDVFNFQNLLNLTNVFFFVAISNELK